MAKLRTLKEQIVDTEREIEKCMQDKELQMRISEHNEEHVEGLKRRLQLLNELYNDVD